MARVVTFVPDLLFGSNVLGAMRAGGHDAVLASDPSTLRGELATGDALIVDLTAEAPERIALVRELRPPAVPVLAFYSHVESDVRELAQAAGFELVVPRSRLAREGAALVDRLLAGGAAEHR